MRHAFSLIELSIVLVILGLLTGGILAGQSLIRASELRAVSTEYSRYVTAVQTFRDKYFALPGDMTNATAFWGKDNTNCASHSGTAATPGTCNGNGSGTVHWFNNEKHRFWQQLAFAGLIEGSYLGTSTLPYVIVGTDAPASKLSRGGWGSGGEGNGVGMTTAWGANGSGIAVGYGNFFTFGAQTTTNNPLSGILKAEEAWNIDSKMDDGMPGLGKVITYVATGVGYCDNRADNTDYNTTYKLTESDARCAFYLRNAF